MTNDYRIGQCGSRVSGGTEGQSFPVKGQVGCSLGFNVIIKNGMTILS